MDMLPKLSSPLVEAYGDHVTIEQVDRVMSHFGRHKNELVEVQADYDFTTGELYLVGEPSEKTSAQFAQQSLEQAIRAARALHPADNLDISA